MGCMPETVDNLLKLNVLDSDIKNVVFYTICSSRPDLILKDKTFRRQIPIFMTGEQTLKDKWPHEDFDYEFSELGFRDVDLPESVDLAAFGCSYTFGVGLPIKRTWHKLLADKHNLTSYNFGQPGASIKTISDIFCIVSNNVKIKKAVILLPSYMRASVTTQSLSKSIKFYDLLPTKPSRWLQSSSNTNVFDILHDMYYKYTPDAEFIRTMKDAVYMIEYLAKTKNIELFISSWDRPTYDLLKVMEFKYAKLIDEWVDPSEFNHITNSDYARDGNHPGILHHEYWANKITGQVTT
jgi:hypothetical protein